jgi:Zn-dependent protease with chaperone function
MERKILTGIEVEAFQSEADRAALAALKKIPLFPELMRKFYEIGVDRWLYCMNMATSVRCGPNQYKTLYGILEDSAKVLDMPVPELYITSHPQANAMAGGVERPYITVRSSMIETLSDDELYHLFGHELGHIKCGHVLYYSIARVLRPLLDLLARRTLGVGDAVSWALLAAFFQFQQQAEISADRAGLLVAQNFETSANANLSMTAGWNRMSNEQSTDAFLDQARMYQDMSMTESVGKMLLFLFVELWISHPMPVHRMKALEQWVEDGEFDKIMKGDYLGAPAAVSK